MVIQPKAADVIAVLAISGGSVGQVLTASQPEHATTGDALDNAKSSPDLLAKESAFSDSTRSETL